MLNWLLIAAAVVTGLFFGLALCWLKKKGTLDFSKIIVLWLLSNGTGWVWCSYYLAYIGATEIAETLSRYVAVEILGTLATYSIKAGVENLSKNNTWPDKPKRDA